MSQIPGMFSSFLLHKTLDLARQRTMFITVCLWWCKRCIFLDITSNVKCNIMQMKQDGYRHCVIAHHMLQAGIGCCVYGYTMMHLCRYRLSRNSHTVCWFSGRGVIVSLYDVCSIWVFVTFLYKWNIYLNILMICQYNSNSVGYTVRTFILV